MVAYVFYCCPSVLSRNFWEVSWNSWVCRDYSKSHLPCCARQIVTGTPMLAVMCTAVRFGNSAEVAVNR